MPTASFPRALYVFMAIGIVIALAIVALAAYAPAWLPAQDQGYNPLYPFGLRTGGVKETAVPTLGEMGSRCGGPERLPCGPGSLCSVGASEWATKYGTCLTDPAGARPTTPTGQ